MELKKELLEFLEANNLFGLEDRENAEGVVDSYLKVYKKQLTLTDAGNSCVDKSTLIEDLDDKRIIGTLVNKDGWYYCRKETAQYLLDKYEIKIK